MSCHHGELTRLSDGHRTLKSLVQTRNTMVQKKLEHTPTVKTDAPLALLKSLEDPKFTTLAEAAKKPPVEILPPGMPPHNQQKASFLHGTVFWTYSRSFGCCFKFWTCTGFHYSSMAEFKVLKVLPSPLTITNIQFAVGSILVLFMWTTNIYKQQKICEAQLAAILPLAIVHTMGNLFTNMSLGKVAVSFTHTIKAMEPFFSVLHSAIFLGEDDETALLKQALASSMDIDHSTRKNVVDTVMSNATIDDPELAYGVFLYMLALHQEILKQEKEG